MEGILSNRYAGLALISILWCTFHSLLIAWPVSHYFKSRMGVNFRYYRILYNAFSLLTLLPVIYLEHILKADLLFSWDGTVLQLLRIILLVISLLVFYLGSRQYDGKEFLGLRQLKSGAGSRTLSASGELNTAGILNIIRHPWYLGSLIIIWLRPLYLSVLIVNIIFSLYLIAGSLLEERKLVREFGDQYRSYRERVSMLIPLRWLWLKVRAWLG